MELRVQTPMAAMNDLNAGLDNEIARSLGLGKSPGISRLSKPWLAAALIVLIAAGGAVAWMLREQAEPVQYKTEPVQRGNMTVSVTATGTLVPTKQVDVGIEISGTIRSVEVDYNDRVKISQVLARLDTTKLEAQLQQTTATLESARAKLLQTKATVRESTSQLGRLERLRELTEGEAPSQQDLDTARATLDRARADEASAAAIVSQTEAILEANRTDLSKAVIHSPINGIVLKRAIDPGQTVAASFQAPVLFTLAEDLTQMQLQVDVDEADVGKVLAGQKASFTVDAFPDRTFPARIIQVRYGPQTVANVVTYKAVLNVDNSGQALRPGMTATSTITVKQVDGAILVPNAALRFSPPAQESAAPPRTTGLVGMILPRPPRQGPRKHEDNNARQQRVWVLQEGQLHPVPVTIGDSDRVSTEIVSGAIEPGTAVVTGRIAAAK